MNQHTMEKYRQKILKFSLLSLLWWALENHETNETTVKILKFGTPQTIAIIVLKIEKFDVTLR